MRAFAAFLVTLSLLGAAQAQTSGSAIFPELLGALTGGSNGTSSQAYLYSVASELASGFEGSLEGIYNKIVNNSQDLTKQGVLDKIVSEFQSTFCTSAVYTAASKSPASLTGPGFSLSLSGGGCIFNDTAFSNGSGDIDIDCVGPSVTVKKTPAVFVSKSNDPETFVSSFCSISSTLEDKISDTYSKNITFSKDKSTTTEVLFVFDHDSQKLMQLDNAASTAASAGGLDTSSVSSLVSSAFMEALGLINNPVQGVSNFVQSLGADAQTAISNVTSAAGSSASSEVNTLLTILAGK